MAANVYLKLAAVFLTFCLSQLVIIHGAGYVFITQPPSDLPCNPHSSTDLNTSLRLECSIGILGTTQVPADTSILWYHRRAPSCTEEQLCSGALSKFMAATLFEEKFVGLRSIIEVEGSSGDLIGEYWCQVVAKIGVDDTLLSNRSSVLKIHKRDYYLNKTFSSCEAGTIFLELSTSQQSLEFDSSFILSAEDDLCAFPTEPPKTTTMDTTTNTIAAGGEMEESFAIPLMWVYILAPVAATLLIFLFLFLLTALAATCLQKRDPRKMLPSTTANIENAVASNCSTMQSKSTISSVKSTATVPTTSAHSRSTTQSPLASTPRPSPSIISAGSALHLNLISKQMLPASDKDQRNETIEREESGNYVEVTTQQERKVAKVVGKPSGACNANMGPRYEEMDSSGSIDDAKYHSLDPNTMEPRHTYHKVQPSTTAANVYWPQPRYSETGVNGHQEVEPNGKKQRPPPPLKTAPQISGSPNKPALKKSVLQSVPSVDGEYIDLGNYYSPTSYQSQMTNKPDYLALNVAPNSTPH